jgi:hypothetical protein
VEATQTPSPDHVEFDQLCAQVEEWEPLPAFSMAPLMLETEPKEEERTEFDERILAGLVSPV